MEWEVRHSECSSQPHATMIVHCARGRLRPGTPRSQGPQGFKSVARSSVFGCRRVYGPAARQRMRLRPATAFAIFSASRAISRSIPLMGFVKPVK